MTQNNDKEVISFLDSLFKDLDGVYTSMTDRLEELQEAMKRRNFDRCIEISAEIIALCGSIMPLQNLKEGIELSLNKDNLQ